MPHGYFRTVARCAMLVCVLATASFQAGAISIRELRTLEVTEKDHGEDFVQYYLVGAMEGAFEAHASMVRAGAKPVMCLRGRRLEPRMAKPLFDGELKRNAHLYEADMPVQLVLVNAMVSAYGC